jgi:hypothetical protein
MKAFEIPTVTDQDGKTRNIEIDPHVYTSVSDWKPIAAERFVELLHRYTTMDKNLDRFGHGLMSQTAFHLSKGVNAVIHYSVKTDGSPVSQPVLMTMNYEDSKRLVHFASIFNGIEAEDNEGRPPQPRR